MTLDDIPRVQEIEREAFTLPWPSHAYRRELKDNKLAHYLVIGLGDDFEPTPAADDTAPAVTWLDSLKRLFGDSSAQLVPTSPPIAGYAGLWLMVDEAHVTTIAVRGDLRGRGLGELLLIALADVAVDIGARWLTLEVRVTNYGAQNLYRKFGFTDQGIRKRYYSDNGEDALIMWSEALDSPQGRERFTSLRRELLERLGPVPMQILPGRKPSSLAATEDG
ncbi:MAG: ribosomal protein S18-alanine N-acetyltransferase [Chloroflexi bacterium]|nr:ribosomal protein S18-alanine N-acetyltransferase [Chloroflexota bacterium]